jgi:hypothetical protein
MKATLEFKLPEEQAEFEAASSVHKYQSFMWEFEEEIRSAWKHNSGRLKDIPFDALDKVREAYYDMKANAGVPEDL